jgi:hypothetical protein
MCVVVVNCLFDTDGRNASSYPESAGFWASQLLDDLPLEKDLGIGLGEESSTGNGRETAVRALEV